MSSTATPAPKENMGKPEPRLDAIAKVTGAARYAADQPVRNPAHAWLVTSSIARGRVTGFDTAETHQIPGVIQIMTHENRPKLGEFKFFGVGGESSTAKPPLSSDRIDHEGEIVALIIAETFEAAREAGHKLKVEYAPETPAATLDSRGTETKAGASVNPEQYPDIKVGDADAAFAAAPVKIEAEYETPTQHHNAIELYSTTCAWEGDELTVYEPSQFVVGLQNGLAREIGVEPGKITVISPYIGGAFGSKGGVTPRTSLIAMAAKTIGRPVKLVVQRDQGFTIATYRAETRHRVKLAADRDGKMTAYLHEAWELSSRADDYLVSGTTNTTAMYATPAISTKVHVVKADRNTPGFMRSPPEVPYMYALESAVDELAVALKMDPVELRRKNDTDKNPVTGAPYTSRSLMKCYDEAAAAFGWKDWSMEAGTKRDGDWLVGFGCATASYPTQLAPAVARVQLTADQKVRVQIASHDVGTGAYTVIGQMAAELLGAAMSNVKVELGDSRLPPGPVAGGSVTTASSCSAVKLACDAILRRLTGQTDVAAMKVEGDAITAADGQTIKIADAFKKLGTASIEEVGEFVPKDSKPGALEAAYKGSVMIVGGAGKTSTMFAFGAEFVEVRVHARTREIRVPRIVGAFAGGHIKNTRTANSQYLGGLVWGISSALHEETEIDRRNARYINDNIAEYLVPVNADVQDVQIIMVPEIDTEVNPAGIKGIGELSNVGTAAAVANAVYNATGIRIRKLPIRIEKLLA
jgi:xanthine dehydrogenase YagR molybdenum-binding subunit